MRSGWTWVLAALIWCGCAARPVTLLDGPTRNHPYHTPESRFPRWRTADSLWTLRADPPTAQRMLKAYRSASKKRPGIPELSANHSRACAYVATYLESDREKMNALYREGQAAAMRALMMDPGFKAAYRESGDETEAVRKLDAGFLEPLYWYTVNLARELNQETEIIRLGNRDRLEAFNGRALELDPGFYHGGPLRIAGLIPTRVPGGDLAEAKRNLEQAIAIAPLYFGNRVAFAEYLALAAQDRQAFTEHLGAVMRMSADTLPEIAPENHYAQERARALLASIETVFK